MLKIGACDDDQRILNQLESLIENAIRGTKEKVEFSQFSSGEEFCARAELDMLDILYLDIEMEDIDGIKTAEHLRLSNTHAKLIYVSSHDNYLRQLFSVNTFGYIDKPIDEIKFNRLFYAACADIRSYNDIFPYQHGKTIHRVLLREIMYFRSIAHVIAIHCLNGDDITYYEKLSEVMDKLSAVEFIQISKSYVVNLRHVCRLNLSEVTMMNGEVLSISRALHKEVFNTYCRYMERRTHR